MSIDVVTLALAKAYADELVANGGDPEKTEQIIRDKINEILGNIGGGADWAVNDETAAGYIKNRTHFKIEPYTISWNGDITDKEQVSIEGVPYVFYKVIEEIPTPSEILELDFSNIKVNWNGTTMSAEDAFGDSEDFPSLVGEGYWFKTPLMLYAEKEVEVDLSTLGTNATFKATKGLWVLRAKIEEDETINVIYLEEINFTGVQKIDASYIPESIDNKIELTDHGNYARLKITNRHGKTQSIYINDGQNGATFTPSISADGYLSWTNDKYLTNPATIKVRGGDGEPGYTPQKGIDYMTDEDIEMLKAAIEEEIIAGEW